jgi:hypothetical protein
LVIMTSDTETGEPCRETADLSKRQPVLHMRQESNEFINFCSLVLSPDRAQMVEGEWMQLDLTSDANAWAEYQAAPFTTPKPQPDLESFAMWGWWRANRVDRQVDLSEDPSEREPGVQATGARSGATMEPLHELVSNDPAPPQPGVIGTPRQWAAGMPLRRPPTCIYDAVAQKGEWADPDPDPTAKLGVSQQREEERTETQAWTRQRTLDGWH